MSCSGGGPALSHPKQALFVLGGGALSSECGEAASGWRRGAPAATLTRGPGSQWDRRVCRCGLGSEFQGRLALLASQACALAPLPSVPTGGDLAAATMRAAVKPRGATGPLGRVTFACPLRQLCEECRAARAEALADLRSKQASEPVGRPRPGLQTAARSVPPRPGQALRNRNPGTWPPTFCRDRRAAPGLSSDPAEGSWEPLPKSQPLPQSN